MFISCPYSKEDDDPILDRDLIKKLAGERGAYMVHCIKLALETLKRGTYPESDCMRQHAKKVELQGDAIKAFVHFRCVFEQDAFVPSSQLHLAYRQYCAENGHKDASQTTVIDRLMTRWERAKCLEKDQRRIEGSRNAVRGIIGLRLRRPDEEEPEDL